MISGLDNAGKTTIVKQIMNEDVNTVSPTLGFIIKTIDYEGFVWLSFSDGNSTDLPPSDTSSIYASSSHQTIEPVLTAFQGMLEGKRHYARTGGITLRRLTL